jgi:hypothetical protein
MMTHARQCTMPNPAPHAEFGTLPALSLPSSLRKLSYDATRSTDRLPGPGSAAVKGEGGKYPVPS